MIIQDSFFKKKIKFDKCKDIKLPPLSKERKKSFLNFCKKYVEDKLWHMGRYELAIAGNITSIEQILKEHKGKEPLSPPSRKWKEAAERVEEQFKKVKEISELLDQIKETRLSRREIFRNLRLQQLKEELKEKNNLFSGSIPLYIWDKIIAENKKKNQ